MIMPFVAMLLIVCGSRASAQRTFTDTIPIQFHNGHILMPVTINGEPRRMVFDTGCTNILLWGADSVPPFKPVGVVEPLNARSEAVPLSEGLVLAEFGSQKDSLLSVYSVLPEDSALRGAFLNTGDGMMGFTTLIRRGLGYYVKVDLKNGIMVVSNDRKLARNIRGARVHYRRCDSLPVFAVSINKRHKAKVWLDSGSPVLCKIDTRLLERWLRKDDALKGSKVSDGMASGYLSIGDTTVLSRRSMALKCDLDIKSFHIKDAMVMNNPDGDNVIGSFIFQKAAVVFDPWHRDIIFQPYE